MTEPESLMPIEETQTIKKGTINLFYQLLDDAWTELDGNAAMPLIVIDGGQLSGKTTLSIIAIDYVNKKFKQPEFNLDEKDNIQYAMGGDQFLKKLPEVAAKGYHIIVYDEAGDYARKGALTRFNKILDQAMDKVRVWKCIVIFICHYFPKQIPSELINKGIVACLVHCISRKPYQTFTSVKVYERSICAWMVNYYAGLMKNPTDIYNLVPNFMFNFNDIAPERSAKLATIGMHKKKESWDLADIKMNGLMNINELADNLHRSVCWCRKKMIELGIKADRTYKVKKYYSLSTAEALRRAD